MDLGLSCSYTCEHPNAADLLAAHSTERMLTRLATPTGLPQYRAAVSMLTPA